MAYLVQKYGGSSVATPSKIRGVAERILEELARGRVVVVAGFQGANEQLDITTLGRADQTPPRSRWRRRCAPSTVRSTPTSAASSAPIRASSPKPYRSPRSPMRR